MAEDARSVGGVTSTGVTFAGEGSLVIAEIEVTAEQLLREACHPLGLERLIQRNNRSSNGTDLGVCGQVVIDRA